MRLFFWRLWRWWLDALFAPFRFSDFIPFVVSLGNSTFVINGLLFLSTPLFTITYCIGIDNVGIFPIPSIRRVF